MYLKSIIFSKEVRVLKPKINRKRITDKNVVLSKISDEQIDNLLDKFYSWVERTFSPDILQNIEGISYKTVERILGKEKKDINWTTVKVLADAANVSVDSIFGLEKNVLSGLSKERYELALLITSCGESFSDTISKIHNEYISITMADYDDCPGSMTVPGFARRVNMHRLEKNIPLETLADCIGVKDLSLVSVKRLNKNGVRIKKLLSLALALKISADFLVGHKVHDEVEDKLMDNYYLLCELPLSSIKDYSEEILRTSDKM